jgi:hypothetical protein
VTDAVKPPLTTTTSILPAMVVLLIAVVTLGGFLLINVIANPHVRTTPTTVPIIVGGLGADPTNQVLAGCHQADSPPANITPALLVPVRTSATTPVSHRNAGAGEYDCERSLRTAASSGAVLGFYSAHLQALGWHLFSRGTSGGTPQFLFQKAGADTFYWVVGVTVNATGPGTVDWTYRIYQNSAAI